VNIFFRELKANYKFLLVWALALALLNFFMMYVYPSFAADVEALEKLVEMYPEGLLKVFGLDRISLVDPLGFYATEAYFMIILFGSIFAAILGSTLLAKEEDEKTIEFLLARPVTRTQVLTNKILAYLVYLLLFNLIIGLVTYGAFEIFDVGTYSRSVLAYLLAAPFFAHFTFASLGFLSSLFFSRRKSASSAGIGFVLTLYFFDALASFSKEAEFLRYLSPFYYMNAAEILLDGRIDPLNALILLAISAAALGFTHQLYSRRDILI